MDGKTHFKLGLISAASATLVASNIIHNDALLICTPIAIGASVLTSQLPDIDSKRSRISKKIPIVNWMKSKNMILISLVLMLIVLLDYRFTNLFSQEIHNKIFYTSIIILLTHLFFKIFFKHRKLTHCILSCLLVTYVGFLPFMNVNNLLFLAFGLGFSSGYISHIFYDCRTVRGCELFYPILKVKVKGKWKSEKDAKKAMKLSFVILTICALYYFNIFHFIFYIININF